MNLIGFGQRAGGVRPESFGATGVRVDAPVVAVDAEAAPHNPVIPRRPGEAYAWQEDVVNRRLDGVAPIVRREPDGAGRVGHRVRDGGIEFTIAVGDLVPSALDLPAQAEVQREVGPNLEIVLNEELWAFLPLPHDGRVGRLPGIDVAEKEGGVTGAAASGEGRRLRKDAAELQAGGFHIAPG